MITHLKGTIFSKNTDSVTIDVNGVGYFVSCSSRTAELIPQVGEATMLLTDMIIREDSWQLFGFATESERSWFRLLMTVQGVGARIALAILSSLQEQSLVQAISQQDEKTISIADGVGPKLARRIANELKDKIKNLAFIPASISSPKVENNLEMDILSALANLGYNRSEALIALNTVMDSTESNFDSLFKACLKKLTQAA